MFKIGQFAQIAQVSITQLRYYDEIELFQPIQIDPFTGYRFYSTAQLPRLNQIIALKNLGLSLEQVKRLMDDNIAQEEIRGMFKLRQAQIEQCIEEEKVRLREVEWRLGMIEEGVDAGETAVVIKSIPAIPYLSIRKKTQSYQEMLELAGIVQSHFMRSKQGYRMASVFHEKDSDDYFSDWEIGVYVEDTEHEVVELANDRELHPRILPPVETMATLIFSGQKAEAGKAYHKFGQWMDANHYRSCGASREVYIEWHAETASAVVEVQFPVERQP